jgi:RHS repeat-associated protein
MEGNWNGKDGANKYQYNGKELNDDFGLGWSDHGARFYDPAMARWQTVDPMADSRLSLSPYQYVQNNPINRNDPTGMLDEGAPTQGKSSIEEHNKRGLEEEWMHKKGTTPEKKFEPLYNHLPPRFAGTLWGKGNIFHRALTWLTTGGKTTMDSHGHLHSAVKKTATDKNSDLEATDQTQTRAYVENNSPYTVWCKPEEGSTPISIAPGGRHLAPIDGLCIPELYCNAVFKLAGGTRATVIAGVEFSVTIVFRVVITQSGEVEVYNYETAVGQINGVNELGQGGWKDLDWLKKLHTPTPLLPRGDIGWDDLFNKSNERCK